MWDILSHSATKVKTSKNVDKPIKFVKPTNHNLSNGSFNLNLKKVSLFLNIKWSPKIWLPLCVWPIIFQYTIVKKSSFDWSFTLLAYISLNEKSRIQNLNSIRRRENVTECRYVLLVAWNCERISLKEENRRKTCCLATLHFADSTRGLTMSLLTTAESRLRHNRRFEFINACSKSCKLAIQTGTLFIYKIYRVPQIRVWGSRKE